MVTLDFAPEPPGLPAAAWFTRWWTGTWPIVPTLAAILVLDRRASLRLAVWFVAGGSLAIAAVTLVLQLLRGELNTAPLTNVFWGNVSLLFEAAIPLSLVLVTGWRRVRAVMPLALAVTLVFGFTAVLFRDAVIRALNVAAARSAMLGLAVLTSADVAYYALFMIVSLPVGWAAWRLLGAAADAYQAKRFSDLQMVVDCWWLVVAAEHTAGSLTVTYGPAGVAGGLAAFAAYRSAVWLGLRRWRSPDGLPRRLLLLRVFGYQSRTESLFDRVAQRWRFLGPVQLIGGADLAARTADPGDMLAFVSGRLADNYVQTPADVPRRLERLDLDRDPDGRHRINEIYCRDDVWRPTLQAMLDASDTVLMDLRGFGPRNAGCRFELEQLVRRMPTDHIILVCDRTTDLSLLDTLLTSAWHQAWRSGLARGSGRVALVRVERQSRSELAMLMQRLLGGGGAARMFASGELPPALA
jgi:hypothetical protein